MTDPATIPTVGIHHGIPAEEYHAWPALNHSLLKMLRLSPAHARDLLDHGSTPPSKAQAFGTAVHCATLEPEEFASRYVTYPEGVTGVSKAGKEFARIARETDVTILSAIDARWCKAIARRALNHSRLREWLGRPHTVESSVVWERDGYMCKSRLDLLIPGINTIVDLKTTQTASPEGFGRQIAKYRYHTQAEWYRDGMQRITGQEWDFWFLAVEKRRPFLVTAHELSRGSEAHTVAVAECDELFALYRQCCRTGRWPGYGECFQVTLPDWAYDESIIETPFDSEGE